MKFKSNRKVTLAAMGHVVHFEPGDTKPVPKALEQEAVDQGLEAIVEKGESAPAATSAGDDSVRIGKIKAAMLELLRKNHPNDFTAGGVPKVKVLQAMSQEKTRSNDELLKLWAEVRDSEAAAG